MEQVLQLAAGLPGDDAHDDDSVDDVVGNETFSWTCE